MCLQIILVLLELSLLPDPGFLPSKGSVLTHVLKAVKCLTEVESASL